jgi:hypothetical protein
MFDLFDGLAISVFDFFRARLALHIATLAHEIQALLTAYRQLHSKLRDDCRAAAERLKVRHR